MKVESWTSRLFKVFLVFALVACPFSLAFGEGSESKSYDNLVDALKNGTPGVELRLGYEVSDVDNNTTRTANSVTLRTRLSYRTGNIKLGPLKTSGFIQFHNLSALRDHYSPENLQYDVVADPDGSRVQQAYMDIKAFDTTLRVGRQEIIMDDARLIGNIGWRQNGQSFDAVSLINKSIPDLEIFASYIAKVNTILLTELELGDGGLILSHAKYTGIKDTTLSIYNYLLDSEGSMVTDRDLGTAGARAIGKISVNDTFKIEYEGEYAQNYSYNDGKDFNGYMINGFLGILVHKVGLGGGYSKLSGKKDERKPFDTLVSTAHKFNGWSDQFLGTNGGGLVNGLEDIYLQMKATCKKGKTKLLTRYHFFDVANESTYGGKYGNELDVQTVTKIYKNTTLLLKYAGYFASNGKGNIAGRDENVFWTRLTYKF